MGVEHLEGKRTGRPKGKKSIPPWLRAARWAWANLGKPDAVAPNEQAARLWALGREHPDRLTLMLAELEVLAQEDRRQQGAVATPQTGPTPEAAAPPARRAPSVRMPNTAMVSLKPVGWRFPNDIQVTCQVDYFRQTLTLLLSSTTFRNVPDGAPIPWLCMECLSGFR